jgi:hypothetical protein
MRDRSPRVDVHRCRLRAAQNELACAEGTAITAKEGFAAIVFVQVCNHARTDSIGVNIGVACRRRKTNRESV